LIPAAGVARRVCRGRPVLRVRGLTGAAGALPIGAAGALPIGAAGALPIGAAQLPAGPA
jgi:hypothetical protein